MSDVAIRTSICSVIFVDIVDYSKAPIERQVKMKATLNEAIKSGLSHTQEDELIILDSGDGAAICVFGDPEDALFAATAIAAELRGSIRLRTGINLGPVKVVTDLTGNRNVIGDAINVAQRIMSFANEDEVLISRPYFEIVSCLRDDNRFLFQPLGTRKDKHVREHEVYSVASGADGPLSPLESEDETDEQADEPPARQEIAPEFVELCTVHLAKVLGPMAGPIVRKSIEETASQEEMIDLLASKIASHDERHDFLSLIGMGGHYSAEEQTTDLDREQSDREQPYENGTAEPTCDESDFVHFSDAQLNDALIEAATAQLAKEIGPIARPMINKAASSTDTETSFIEAISAQISDVNARKRFLASMRD